MIAVGRGSFRSGGSASSRTVHREQPESNSALASSSLLEPQVNYKEEQMDIWFDLGLTPTSHGRRGHRRIK